MIKVTTTATNVVGLLQITRIRQAEGQHRPLQCLAMEGHEVVDGAPRHPPGLPHVTDLGPHPGVAGHQRNDGDQGGHDEDEPDGVAQVGRHRVDDGGRPPGATAVA